MLNKNKDDDELLILVRDRNKGKEQERHTGNWVIGDDDFVKRVLNHAEDSRLRISRFEKKGCTLESIAEKVKRKFKVPIETIKKRCRGGIGSDTREIFVYSTVVLFEAPSKIVADYCDVGLAVVSAIAKKGAIIAKIHNFTI